MQLGLIVSTALGASAVWLWLRLLRVLDAGSAAKWGNPWLNRLDALNCVLCRRFHCLEPLPLDLPREGGVLIVANHVSGLDPLLMIAASPRPLRFVIAREQYDRLMLRWLFDAMGCIPIGRHGGHREALAAAQAALSAGEAVALFPEGGIRDGDGPPILKPGVALLAEATGAPVVPVRIEGVAGQGLVLGALFLRSRVRIRAFAPVTLGARDRDSFLSELGEALAGPADNSTSAA